MELKTPIAELHAKEMNVGFFSEAVKSNKTLFIIIGLILIVAVGYYFYNENQKQDTDD